MEKSQLRSFGYIWGSIFLVIGLFPVKNGLDPRAWAVQLAIAFILVSTFYPNIFSKIRFYQAWIKFGNFVGHINSKIIIFILFYGLFLPIGLVLKLFGKDLLHKKLDKKADSYFDERVDQPGSMENQF